MCALVFFAGILADVTAQTAIDSPVIVPLHFQTLASGEKKVGIYLGIGGGTPGLFEFDTGATGLYAVYASEIPSNSPWWGSDVTPTSTVVDMGYASGLHYAGTLALASVSLFASASAQTPLVSTASTALIGQMNSVVDGSGQAVWNGNGETMPGTPPTNGVFYGDLGMGLNYARSGISNLIAQLDYGPNVTAGFRIHIDPVSQQAHVQIGLTEADTNSPTALYFAMNPDGKAPEGATTPVANLPYYAQELLNADIKIKDGATGQSSTSSDTPIITDTGASTSLDNILQSNIPSDFYTVSDLGRGALNENLNFSLSATTTTGETVDFFSFLTNGEKNGGRVGVQLNSSTREGFFLNTGIQLFSKYDVIYDLQSGNVGLEAVPEPSSLALVICGLVVTAGVAMSQRKTRASTRRHEGN